MELQLGFPVFLADAAAASGAMRSFVIPAVATLSTLASLACTFFVVSGGVRYMTSTGNPEKLENAKKIIKNALIGLVLVIAAATLTAILSNAYNATSGTMAEKLPNLAPIEAAKPPSGLVDVLVNAVVGLFRTIVESIGVPFVQALGYFTWSTPMMGENSGVFNIWLAIVGIADVLFILVVVLLGFQVMSFSTLGFDEIDYKQLLPQMAFVFLLINTSIFAIDAIISLSNAMIYALRSAFASTSIWDVLADITKQSGELGLAGLILMIAFLVLTVMLLVYYVGRLITLYLGAILSPLIMLLWLLPAFKDFAITALKTYLTTIFVLFVHVVILLLAASMFTGTLQGDSNTQPNVLMALIVGLATVVALLKTQGVMKEMSYAASGPRAARELSGQFVRGVSSMYRTGRTGLATNAKVASYMKTKFGGQDADSGNKGATGGKSASKSKPLKTGETRKAEKVGKK